MTDPKPPKPALPPHPMSRSARRMLLLGATYLTLGLGVAVLLGGASIMAVGFAFGGAIFIAAGVRMQRIGPAVMINNAAHDLLTQGRYDEALALLDTIPPARRSGLVGMAVLSQRAYVRFAQGDTAGALALSDQALALRTPLIARSHGRQYRLALQANRALMLAAAGESAAARAEAALVDAAPEALPLLKGTVALARAVTYARAGEREALVGELSRSRPMLDQLSGREAVLARALGRLAAVPAGSAYRAPAARDGELSDAARWVVGVVPQAAAFAPRAAQPGPAVDPARLPSPSADALARVTAHRALARKLAPSPYRWRLAAWLALVMAITAGIPYLNRAYGLSLNLGLLAVPVLALIAYAVRHNRGVDRAIRGARALFADGRVDESDAVLTRVSRDPTHTYAAIALHDLAEHAERRDDLPGALALCDRALGRIFKSANVKASVSDILLPSLIALRARVLAAMGSTDDALAELAVVAREHPTFPFATSAAVAVRVIVALRLGDRELARDLARTRTTDARLPRHVGMLFDLLVGEAGWFEADGERERIEGELAAHPGLRAWIERVSPGLTGSYPALTSVRIADLGGAADAEPADMMDAAGGGSKGAAREG
ncbi:MAG: hypothetical protein Q7V43_13240 [Myxococcales bacterium]|nr:hypothetical protein [Myxococcales bacterium]